MRCGPGRAQATLIEQATVDCYNDSEAKTGFLTMIEDIRATRPDVALE